MRSRTAVVRVEIRLLCLLSYGDISSCINHGSNIPLSNYFAEPHRHPRCVINNFVAFRVVRSHSVTIFSTVAWLCVVSDESCCEMSERNFLIDFSTLGSSTHSPDSCLNVGNSATVVVFVTMLPSTSLTRKPVKSEVLRTEV